MEVTKETRDEFYFLDLFTKNPLGRLRLDAQHLNYNFLKDKMQYNLLSNFRTTVEELIRRLPQVRINHGIQVMKNNQPLNQMMMESPANVEKESRWLLTLVSV